MLTTALGLLGLLACSDDTALSPPRAAGEAGAPGTTAAAPARVLLYSKETEWFHTSTPVAAQVMVERGRARGWTVTATKESAIFTPEGLRGFDVVVFLISSGKTLDESQRGAFASWVAAGHGWAGAHAASHTDYDWVFMRDLVGASFLGHPPIMEANALLDAPDDPIVAHLPKVWTRTDEWYTFDRRPELDPNVRVLLSLDETSARPDYPGPNLPAALRVGAHPITWKQNFGATRSFYTGMGHTVESWQDEAFVTMMVNGIEWAASR